MNRLNKHPNSLARELIEEGRDMRRLKRFKPLDFNTRFNSSSDHL